MKSKKKLIPHSIRRKLIQIAAFGLSNSHVGNFASARLYTGKWKNFCNPGLNCYSCPAATLSCPIGALQAVNGSMQFQFSFYVVGFLLACGVLLGRWICGFLCPFGLFQELLALLPLKKFRLPRWTKYIKFFVLILFVFLLPWVEKTQNFMGIGDPTFCKYICPAGLLFGGVPLLLGDSNLQSAIGPVFSLKLSILILVLLACLVVYRFFCKVLCPLGAIYGLLNKISFYRMTINTETCTRCGHCSDVCRMDLTPMLEPDSMECIRCGDCVHACPHQSIHIGFHQKRR